MISTNEVAKITNLARFQPKSRSACVAEVHHRKRNISCSPLMITSPNIRLAWLLSQFFKYGILKADTRSCNKQNMLC